MYHKLRSSHYNKMSAQERYNAQKDLVMNGRGSGIIIYADNEPVAWCQVGKAEEFLRYNHSKLYKALQIPESLKPEWRISCFFVDRKRRKEHLSSYALDSALDYIKSNGGGIVEAFPKFSAPSGTPSYAGSQSMYERCGFEYIAKLGTSTFLMRKMV
jgi:GNAT superfamily N-acetyltransferase